MGFWFLAANRYFLFGSTRGGNSHSIHFSYSVRIHSPTRWQHVQNTVLTAVRCAQELQWGHNTGQNVLVLFGGCYQRRSRTQPLSVQLCWVGRVTAVVLHSLKSDICCRFTSLINQPFMKSPHLKSITRRDERQAQFHNKSCLSFQNCETTFRTTELFDN